MRSKQHEQIAIIINIVESCGGTTKQHFVVAHVFVDSFELRSAFISIFYYIYIIKLFFLSHTLSKCVCVFVISCACANAYVAFILHLCTAEHLLFHIWMLINCSALFANIQLKWNFNVDKLNGKQQSAGVEIAVTLSANCLHAWNGNRNNAVILTLVVLLFVILALIDKQSTFWPRVDLISHFNRMHFNDPWACVSCAKSQLNRNTKTIKHSIKTSFEVWQKFVDGKCNLIDVFQSIGIFNVLWIIDIHTHTHTPKTNWLKLVYLVKTNLLNSCTKIAWQLDCKHLVHI